MAPKDLRIRNAFAIPLRFVSGLRIMMANFNCCGVTNPSFEKSRCRFRSKNFRVEKTESIKPLSGTIEKKKQKTS